uniref:Uncharacterized protein n=1 Tax=Romanomermis culicivorax TaxID=13658 RepID=A0A915IQR4_ROMCU
MSVVKMKIATNDSKFSIHNGQPALIFRSISRSTSVPRFTEGFVFITFGRKGTVHHSHKFYFLFVLSETELVVRYGANCGQAQSILCKIGDYDDQIAKVGKILWMKDNVIVKISADANFFVDVSAVKSKNANIFFRRYGVIKSTPIALN